MALLTSHILILTHSLSLLTISYFLLTNPAILLTSSPIWILGESMHVRRFTTPSSTSPPRSVLSSSSTSPPKPTQPSDSLALAALILAFTALTQTFFASGLAPNLPTSTNKHSHAPAPGPGTSSTTTVPAASSLYDQNQNQQHLGETLSTQHHQQTQWLSLSGVLVVFFGLLTGWVYLFHSQRFLTTPSASKNPSGMMELLSNDVVLTTAMTEMLFWGYTWTVLKEEQRQLARLVARLREDNR